MTCHAALTASVLISITFAVPVSTPSPPAAQRAMKLTDFRIRVGERTVTGLLAEPEEGGLAPDPALLLTFASTRRETMTVAPYP